MLKESSYNESSWQYKISKIISIIEPKYIFAVREFDLGNDGRTNKRPDFILVDANGFVDILEIKTPQSSSLMKQKKYRNNYIPDNELSNAIEQLEKYLYTMNKNMNNIEKNLSQKLNMDIKIMNPKGILIIGRECDLNKEQLEDFEMIKRQYRNIAEIISYESLLRRVSQIKESLKQNFIIE